MGNACAVLEAVNAKSLCECDGYSGLPLPRTTVVPVGVVNIHGVILTIRTPCVDLSLP